MEKFNYLGLKTVIISAPFSTINNKLQAGFIAILKSNSNLNKFKTVNINQKELFITIPGSQVTNSFTFFSFFL